MNFSDKSDEWAFRRMEALHSKSGHLYMTDAERAAENEKWLKTREAEIEAARAA